MISWEQEATLRGCSHLIIMYDPDDREEYPVFVLPTDDLHQLCQCLTLSEGHQKIKEIRVLRQLKK